jgi:hypothetical protein
VDVGPTCLSRLTIQYDVTTDGPVMIRFSDGRSIWLQEAGATPERRRGNTHSQHGKFLHRMNPSATPSTGGLGKTIVRNTFVALY